MILKRCLIVAIILTLMVLSMIWFITLLHGAVPLGNGYVFSHISSCGIRIYCLPQPNSFRKRIERIAQRNEAKGVISTEFPTAGPGVDGYHVYSRIIAGHVSKESKNAVCISGPKPPVFGYFIIDKQSDIIYDGLIKREWLKKLREFDVMTEPVLFKPSIYDGLLGRNEPSKGKLP